MSMNILFLFVILSLLSSGEGSCFSATEPNITWVINPDRDAQEISNVTDYDSCFGLFIDKLSSIGITYQALTY